MTRTPSHAFVAPCGPDRARFEAARAMAAAVRHRVAVALGLAALVAGGLAAGSTAAGAAPAPDVAAGAPARRLPAADATFPVPLPFPASVSDGWHACRDGCRRQHKGNDIFAPEGAPAVAVESGVIAKVDQTDDGLGGLTVWLRGDSGVTYYYAHNSANLVREGERVARGQPVARVGHTGNARTTPAHIHFQVNLCGRLDSDEPCTVDPYPFLRAWQQRTPAPGPDGVGVVRRDANGAVTVDRLDDLGAPLAPVTLGDVPTGALPVAGDWDGDGLDTVGLYNRASGNLDPRGPEGSPGAARVAVGPVGTDVVPVAGDWDGDGRDTLALVNPGLGAMRQAGPTGALGPILGVADPRPGVPLPPPPGAAAVPPAGPPVPPVPPPDYDVVAGDWDGDGDDAVALVDPATSQVTAPAADVPEPVAALPVAGLAAVAGDWDGDGHDSLGLFDPATGTFHVGLGVRQVPAPRGCAGPACRPAGGGRRRPRRPAGGAAVGRRGPRHAGAVRPDAGRGAGPAGLGRPPAGGRRRPRPRPGRAGRGPLDRARHPPARARRRRGLARGRHPGDHGPVVRGGAGPSGPRGLAHRVAGRHPHARHHPHPRDDPAGHPRLDRAHHRAGPDGAPAQPDAHGPADRSDRAADGPDRAADGPDGPADGPDGPADGPHGPAHRPHGAADRPDDGPDVPHDDRHDRAAGDRVDDVHHGGGRPLTGRRARPGSLRRRHPDDGWADVR